MRVAEKDGGLAGVYALERLSADALELDAGRGPKVVRRHMEGLRTTFPDFTMRVVRSFVDGDYVITMVIGEGTHRGAWRGITPSGWRVRLRGINIDRVRDGRIVEHWGEADTLVSFNKGSHE